MGSRRLAAAVAGSVLAVSALVAGGAWATVAAALPAGGVRSVLVDDPTTTTTVPATTTTTILPTTTTVPATTTTTTVPATTTTTSPTTTTTHATTTTTVPATTTTTTGLGAAPAKGHSSGTVWLLVVIAVVLVAAVVALVVLLGRRSRRSAEATWRAVAAPALDDARLAREALVGGSAGSDDPVLRGSVEVQVGKAATALEQSAAKAPDDLSRDAATSAAGSLRGLAFAIEADRLLRHGTSAPSGVQLAQADDARRARIAELDAALRHLASRVAVHTRK